MKGGNEVSLVYPDFILAPQGVLSRLIREARNFVRNNSLDLFFDKQWLWQIVEPRKAVGCPWILDVLPLPTVKAVRFATVLPSNDIGKHLSGLILSP